MTVSLLTSLLIGLSAIVLSYLLFKYCRLIKICVLTIPRDVLGIYCLFCLQLNCLSNKWRNLTVFQYFDKTCSKYPDKPCFLFEDEKWTFSNIQEYSLKIANYFKSQGFLKGDKVALFIDNRPEYIACWLGLSRIGVIASLININLRQESLKHALEILPHKAIIFEDSIAREPLNQIITALGYQPSGNLYVFKKISGPTAAGGPTLDKEIDLEKELQKVTPTPVSVPSNFDDPLYYSFTSGTTGFPKAAIIKHSRFFLAGLSAVHVMRVKHSDVQYTPLPLYHTTAGMLGLGTALFNGTTIVLRRKFSASSFWQDCIKYKVTVAQYIGETLRYIYSQPPSPLDRQHQVTKLFGLGLRKDLWANFVDRFGIEDIKELYGSTEGNCNMVNIDGKEGACGFLPRWAYPWMPYKLVKVTDEGEIIRGPGGGGIPCGVGEVGELIGRIYPRDPLRNFEGYSDRRDTERKIFRWGKGGEGGKGVGGSQNNMWFRSGDLLVMDEWGYFYFKDRAGDTFRWKGENVSTMQVEGVIGGVLGGKRDVAVYGVRVKGCEGRAGMIAIGGQGENGEEGDLNLRDLAREIQNKLPNYARPLFLRLKGSLEFTSTHKIKKGNLQREGFNIEIINDPIYFLTEGNYVPLTEEIYNGILHGTIRI